MKVKLMIIGCVVALLGVAQAALGADSLHDEVRAKLPDPAKWTYPDWSEGLPKPPKEETKATIDTRAKIADYLSFMETSFLEYERPAANMLLDELASGASFIGRRPPFEISSTITLAVELYERTGKKSYLDWAKMAFGKYLQGANKAHEKEGESFVEIGRRLAGAGTGTYQYGIMVYMVSKHVDLTDQRFKPIREMGIGATKYNPETGDPMRMYNCGNHATRQFAGAAFVAKACEKDPEVKWLLDGCNFGWKWYQWKQSVQENDSSYGFYCLNPMLQLARAYGDGVEAFKDQGYQALLERYAYLTTPSGYYPHFGYAIGMYPCLKKVTVAEIAARATDDPACLYYANKLYSRMFRGYLKKSTAGAYETPYVTNLLSLPKTDMRPAAPKVLSKVYRTNQWNLDKESMDKITEGKLNRQIPDSSVISMGYDKLVLKTSNAPGGAMIMMDLATRRGGADKSHPEMRPAIQYYEAQNTPLWYGFKYTRFSRSSNLVWLTPPDLEFPHMENCKDPERVKRIDTAFNVVDYGRNPRNLEYGDVLAENKGADAYGLVEFTSYYRHDTSLTRRLLLTHEGILVIRDDLIPGQSVDGYKAGSLWNPLQAATRAHTLVPQRDGGVPQPETGENWWDFAAPRALLPCDLDDTNVYTSELMVYHGRATGRSFGMKDLPEGHTHPAKHPSPWPTTYSCQTVKAGEPVTFITVLIPHPPEVTGKMLADNLSINVEDGVATVSLKYKGQTLKMEMGKGHKSWQVLRQ